MSSVGRDCVLTEHLEISFVASWSAIRLAARVEGDDDFLLTAMFSSL